MSYTNLYCESAVFLLEHPDALFEDIPGNLLHYWLEVDREYCRSNGWENPLFRIFLQIEAFACPTRKGIYTLGWIRKRFDDFRFFIEKEAQAREAGGHLSWPVPIGDLWGYFLYRVAVRKDERMQNAAEKE